MSDDRKVTRVLVMLEYGPDDPESGEVYDLTELAQECRRKGCYSAEIQLHVKAENYVSRKPDGTLNPDKVTATWGTYMSPGCVFSHHAARLEDVINAGLPDNEAVAAMKKRATRLRKKADSIDWDAGVEKLRWAATIRGQYPIAKVMGSALAAPGIADQVASKEA